MDRDKKGRFILGHSLTKTYASKIYTSRRSQNLSASLKGRKPWNKGKTKETDEAVRRNSISISKSMSQKCKEDSFKRHLQEISTLGGKATSAKYDMAKFARLVILSPNYKSGFKIWWERNPQEAKRQQLRASALGFRARHNNSLHECDGKKFDSREELEVYKILKAKFNELETNIPVGHGVVDFKVGETFIEYHPIFHDPTYPKEDMEDYYRVTK